MTKLTSTARAGVGAHADSAAQEELAARGRELIARLTRWRVASGLSQAYVAALMQTSQSAVARLESGQHDAQLSTLARYAGALGLALDFVEDTRTQGGDSSIGPGAGAGETPPQDPDQVLAWRQHKVVRATRDSVQKRGYPPLSREIAEVIGLGDTSGVPPQLSTLRHGGHPYPDTDRPRAGEAGLPDGLATRPEPGREEDETAEMPGIGVPVQEAACVPLLRRIASGWPTLAEHYVEDAFLLPRQVVGYGPLFLLKVSGDAMTGVAIMDGDWVVVRERSLPHDGDLVAVDIAGTATVRTFKQGNSQAWLVAHNSKDKPIPADADKTSILGLVVSVLRTVPENVLPKALEDGE